MTEITITVKCSNDTKYTITVDKSKTVLEFKQLIAEKSETPVDRQRLIYSGKVLKDNDTLETYKIAEGHTVHMVKSLAPRDSSQTSQSTTQSQSTTTTTTTTTNTQQTQPQAIPPFFAGMPPNLFATNPFGPNAGNNNNGVPNWNVMEQALNNPALMQYVSQMMQDPQFIDNVIAMNPQFSSMAPQLRQLTQDPLFQALLSNPDAIRYMATINPLMGNNTGGYDTGMFPTNPSTTNPTTGNRTTTTSPASNDNNTTASTTTTPTTTAPTTTNPSSAPQVTPQINPFLSLFNPTGNLNTNQQQQQQPFFPNDPSFLYGLGGLNIPPTVPQQPPEERFQVQLQQLNDMGFWDPQKNIRALLASGGNVNAAIELLLSDTF